MKKKLDPQISDKKSTTIKILFIGDIVQKIGRRAVARIVPDLKKELGIDLVIANGEHASTGMGINQRGYDDLIHAGVDFITSGNHIWRKPDFIENLNDKKLKIIRPANFPEGVPGRGYDVITIKGQKVAIINLVGQVFVQGEADSPFRIADEILGKIKAKIKIVDFHAEVTSEKVALGHHLDGRVTAIFGTHTHIPTADGKILPQGTAYVTDVGMVGPVDSILGLEKEVIINRYLTGLPARHTVAKFGLCTFNSVLLEINEKGKVITIERIDKEVMVD